MREPQGVASLALGYGPHWAFSPHLLNPKLELVKKQEGRRVGHIMFVLQSPNLLPYSSFITKCPHQ